MTAEFYDREVEQYDASGKLVGHVTRLFFRLSKGSVADKNAVGFEFDSFATEAHKKFYHKEHAAYLAKKEGHKSVKAEMAQAATDNLVSADALPPAEKPKRKKKEKVSE